MRPVSIANHHPRLKFPRSDVARVIHTLDRHHGLLAAPGSVLDNEGELSVVFLTDAALARLHADFLDDPTITDVITFEGNPALGTAGEICVSADAAVRHIRGTSGRTEPRLRAADQPAFAHELTLYVVHGWLHLAGYDDLVPTKKRVMRRAEARAMSLLGRTAALPGFRLG